MGFESLLGRILDDLWCKLGANMAANLAPKVINNPSEHRSKTDRPLCMALGTDFARIWVPVGGQDEAKTQKNQVPEPLEKVNDKL